MTTLGTSFLIILVFTVAVSTGVILLETLRRNMIRSYMIKIGFAYKCVGNIVDKYYVVRPKYTYSRDLTYIDEDQLMSYSISDIKRIYHV